MATDKKKLTSPFCMRFTHEERKTLELAAGNRPLAAYIRWLIFKEEIPMARTRGKKPIKDHEKLAKLLAMLGQSRIASNINQLAKAANTGSLPVNDEITQSLNEAVAAIRWMRENLIKAMGLKPQSDKKMADSNDPQG